MSVKQQRQRLPNECRSRSGRAARERDGSQTEANTTDCRRWRKKAMAKEGERERRGQLPNSASGLTNSSVT